MLIEEYLNVIDTAPKIAQKILTNLTVLEREAEKERKTLNREIQDLLLELEGGKDANVVKGELDRKLKTINRNYLKILDVDKKKLNIITSLKSDLEGAIEIIKDTSLEFKEEVARDSLSVKMSRIFDTLEQKVDMDAVDDEDRAYCTCKKNYRGEMVACDSPNCPVEWYHCLCVGLKSAPRKKWICPMCSTNSKA